MLYALSFYEKHFKDELRMQTDKLTWMPEKAQGITAQFGKRIWRDSLAQDNV